MALEFDGEKYRRASAHQKEWGAKLVSELRLQGDESILDLGCGDGVVTAQLAASVPEGRVLGIDASQGMIDSAREQRAGNLQFELMDIGAIDFDGEFDVVFSNATLHWVKDHRKLLANVFRALRAGGCLRWNFAAHGNCRCFDKVVREVMTLEANSAHFRAFEWPWYMPRLEEYRELLAACAFDETRVWGENADRYFPTAEALIGWIDQPSIVPFLSRVADSDKQSFRGAVVERMLRETIQGDGTYFETFRRINVYARK